MSITPEKKGMSRPTPAEEGEMIILCKVHLYTPDTSNISLIKAKKVAEEMKSANTQK